VGKHRLDGKLSGRHKSSRRKNTHMRKKRTLPIMTRKGGFSHLEKKVKPGRFACGGGSLRWRDNGGKNHALQGTGEEELWNGSEKKRGRKIDRREEKKSSLLLQKTQGHLGKKRGEGKIGPRIAENLNCHQERTEALKRHSSLLGKREEDRLTERC